MTSSHTTFATNEPNWCAAWIECAHILGSRLRDCLSRHLQGRGRLVLHGWTASSCSSAKRRSWQPARLLPAQSARPPATDSATSAVTVPCGFFWVL